MRISFGTVLILILILTYASLISFFGVLLTSRWEFTVSTNKTDYAVGEEVQITMSLKNTGYLPQSIASAVPNPAIILIKRVPRAGYSNGYGGQYENKPVIWCFPYPLTSLELNQTMFTIAANHSLIRTFIWNQSWFESYNVTGWFVAGGYQLHAIIPQANVSDIVWEITTENPQALQFSASTEFNVSLPAHN
jgi:hypothetical protein